MVPQENPRDHQFLAVDMSTSVICFEVQSYTSLKLRPTVKLGPPGPKSWTDDANGPIWLVCIEWRQALGVPVPI